jgi:GNAT superfamily N-acetyltransferase
MAIAIEELPMSQLGQYAAIDIAFEVERILEVTPVDAGLGGLVLVERQLPRPYTKDYDALAGQGPHAWAKRFDLSSWGLLIARADGCVGGVMIARDTPGVEMLRGRRDLAVLWDLRVAARARQQGIGQLLFRAAEAWAISHGCRELEVETQNINVPACRFYARQGCALVGIQRLAYPAFPDETQLLWHKTLVVEPEASA